MRMPSVQVTALEVFRPCRAFELAVQRPRLASAPLVTCTQACRRFVRSSHSTLPPHRPRLASAPFETRTRLCRRTVRGAHLSLPTLNGLPNGQNSYPRVRVLTICSFRQAILGRPSNFFTAEKLKPQVRSLQKMKEFQAGSDCAFAHPEIYPRARLLTKRMPFSGFGVSRRGVLTIQPNNSRRMSNYESGRQRGGRASIGERQLAGLPRNSAIASDARGSYDR